MQHKEKLLNLITFVTFNKLYVAFKLAFLKMQQWQTNYIPL